MRSAKTASTSFRVYSHDSFLMSGGTHRLTHKLTWRVHRDDDRTAEAPLLRSSINTVRSDHHKTYRLIESFLKDGILLDQCCGPASVDYNLHTFVACEGRKKECSYFASSMARQVSLWQVQIFHSSRPRPDLFGGSITQNTGIRQAQS